jgi:hypothetical protein
VGLRRAGRVDLASLAQAVTRFQGCYYLGGGLWRLLHPESFDALAGPKPDRFQTDVAAALFSAAGVALLVGTAGPHRHATTRVLASCTGLAAAAIDLRHRHHIRTLFMLEAVVELVMAAASAAPSIAAPATTGRRTSG